MHDQFFSGLVSISDAATKLIQPRELRGALARHLQCDWGNVSDKQCRKNDASIKNEDQVLFSSYQTRDGLSFVVRTTFDQTNTEIALENEDAWHTVCHTNENY